MLARLNDEEAIAASYLSSHGTQLLLQGAPDASREQILTACEEVLKASNLQPRPTSPEEAARAWRARGAEGWLAQDEVWRLSWREAETFAERIMAVLVQEHGEGVGPLRDLLVEACFEQVRPGDGSGPQPTRWETGAPVEVRRAAVLAEARRHLTEEQVQEIGLLLEDRERVRAILHPSQPAPR